MEPDVVNSMILLYIFIFSPLYIQGPRLSMWNIVGHYFLSGGYSYFAVHGGVSQNESVHLNYKIYAFACVLGFRMYGII